ncbi:MAG: peptidoglycan DD-metalloendopeptidase family protein [Anaerolineae bacterium]|nr:peptidoglycan DD-metalloendopeptidase family protein [Anaerolineae bacterium]
MQSSFTKKPSGSLNEGVAPLHEYSVSENAGRIRLPAISYLGSTISNTIKTFSKNEALTSRTVTHVTMALIALLAIGLSRMPVSWGGPIAVIHPLRQAAPEALSVTQPEPNNPPLILSGQLINNQDGVLFRAAVPRTIIPDRSVFTQESSDEIRTYTVEGGDTISGIAYKFGLMPETLVWANKDLEANPDWLSIGQTLTILPVDGVYHQVGGSDTIEGIAGTYKTDAQAIIDHPANALDPDNPLIQPGQWLVVPGGSKPFVPRTVTAYSFTGDVPVDAPVGTGFFTWPASGLISQGFFNYHPAIDIAAWIGAPVLAADSGHVIVSGWDNMYGYHIVIDHSNGYQTLYAHLNTYYVEAGANVVKGEQIGEMGNTGNSTGPHLHFEIRQGTLQVNPSSFLP